MKEDIRILILEDVPNDAALAEQELRQAGLAFTSRRVETRDDFLRELKDFAPDLVLSDYSLPQFTGMEAIELVKERFASIPVIIVTGSINEETAVECMRKGAADYVLKDRLRRLGIAVKGALENKKIKEEKERLEKILSRNARQWKSTFDSISDAVCVLDGKGKIERCNIAMRNLVKRPFQEIIGRSPCDLLHDCAEPGDDCLFVRMGGTLQREIEVREIQDQWFRVSADPVLDEEGSLVGCVHIMSDITTAKRQQEELQFANVVLLTQQESSLDGILVVDEADRIISVNQRFGDLFGVSDEMLAAREDATVLQFVSVKMREPVEFVKRVKYIYAHRDERSQEEIVLGDGRVFDRYSAPMVAADGKYCGRVWYFRDISERKRVEEQLKTALKQLEDIIEFLPDATFIVDRDKRIIAWNRAMEEISGVSKEEMIGKDHYEGAVPFYGSPRPLLIDLVGEDDHELASKYSFVRRNGDRVYAEVFAPALHDNKGAYVWGVACPLLDSNGATVGAIESIRDITEQKQAVDLLRRSEEKYRAIFEQSRDPIVITSREGAVVDANQATLTLFGYKKEELLALEHMASLYSDDSDRLVTARLLTKNGYIKNYEMGYRKKDGTKLDCMVDITSRTDPQGRVVDYQVIIRDVTEQKHLQAQLFQAQKIEAVGRLSGGIAHDFNNLLTIIQGNAELATRKLKEEDPLQELIKPIHEASLQAAGLTSQLLLFSRKLPAERKPLDLNSVLQDRSLMLQRLIGEDIQISVDLDPSPWTIVADRGRLEQVIMNLTVNARDAMPRGGRITLRTTKETVDAEYCKTHLGAQPGRYLCLSVSDTGTGMDKEVMSKIFEPFFTTKGPEKGTGLGLAVVYGVVKDHGGWLNAYSELGLGTTFSIYLPAYFETKEDEPVEEVAPDACPGRGQRILIVEDEKALRIVALKVLGEGGYKAVTAKSAEEAIEVFKREKGEFDLVFTDMVLPRRSGLEVVEELLGRKPSLRVLLCSGYADENSQWPIIQEKGYPMLHKPYAVDDLLKAVKDALEEREGKTQDARRKR